MLLIIKANMPGRWWAQCGGSKAHEIAMSSRPGDEHTSRSCCTAECRDFLAQDPRLAGVSCTTEAAVAHPARLPPHERVDAPPQVFSASNARTGALGGWGDTLSGMQWCVPVPSTMVVPFRWGIMPQHFTASVRCTTAPTWRRGRESNCRV